MSYASTSLIFIREVADANVLPTGTDTFICSYAAITLAIPILGQAAVAFTCLPGLFRAPTWSSDPLENTAACVSLGSITRRPGRCMRSVHQSGEPARPAYPSRRQGSAFAAHEEVRKVFWWLWAPIILAIIWGGILLAIVGASDGDGTNPGHLWSLFPVVDPNSESLSQSQITPSASIYWSQGAQMFDFGGFCWAFILIGAIQAITTLTLHCAELLVNTVRDERSWRQAAKGGHRSANALKSMVGSFPALVLFLLKPAIHWLYGLAISIYFSLGVNMRAPQIFYLGGGVAVLALFTTICALWRPGGPQPATFGHLQTLADLVDVWPKEGEKIFWGEKDPNQFWSSRSSSTSWTELKPLEPVTEYDNMIGYNADVRHAGTAIERLPSVSLGVMYMGFERRVR